MPRPLSLSRALLLGVLLSVPADLTLRLICCGPGTSGDNRSEVTEYRGQGHKIEVATWIRS